MIPALNALSIKGPLGLSIGLGAGLSVSYMYAALWRKCPRGSNRCNHDEPPVIGKNTKYLHMVFIGGTASAGVSAGSVLPFSGGGNLDVAGQAKDYVPFSTTAATNFEDFDVQSALFAFYGFAAFDQTGLFEASLSFPLLGSWGLDLAMTFNRSTGFTLPGFGAGIQTGVSYLEE